MVGLALQSDRYAETAGTSGSRSIRPSWLTASGLKSLGLPNKTYDNPSAFNASCTFGRAFMRSMKALTFGKGEGSNSTRALKFSKKRLALAFAIAGISDAIGAFATPLPPMVWVVDFGTALLLFMVLGRQWLLLPGLALEAIPGLGVLPFWLLVVGAIAVLGTPRPNFERY